MKQLLFLIFLTTLSILASCTQSPVPVQNITINDYIGYADREQVIRNASNTGNISSCLSLPEKVEFCNHLGCMVNKSHYAINMCIMQIALQRNDSDQCLGAGQLVNECYFLLAEQNKDPGICDKMIAYRGAVKNEEHIMACYRSVFQDYTNFSECDRINPSIAREECYFKIGMALSDYSFCKKLWQEDLTSHNNCVIKIALSLNQPDRCKMIEDQLATDRNISTQMIDKCYFKLGQCASISNLEYRKICYSLGPYS